MSTCPIRVVSADDHLLHELQQAPDGWARFEHTFGAYLGALARRMQRQRRASVADREDALQQLRLFVLDPDSPRYAPDRGPATSYLFEALRTAFNAVLGRARRREDPPPVGGWSEGGPIGLLVTTGGQSAYDEHEFIEALFQNIDVDDRRIVEEIADDRSITAIGAVRGVSRPTMSRRLSRIRWQLRTKASRAGAAG
jgi:DNA-directed RNA polymerase specialized sigma24 family protein